MQRISQTVLLILLSAIAGCGQGKPAPVSNASTNSEKTQVSKNAPDAKPSVAPPEKTELVATAVSGTAEATFQQTLIAFQEGRLDKAFDFLPESYQSDVENVVHEFAEKMDSELWSKCFELLNKVSNILKTKKMLILGMDNVKNAPQIESIKPVWDDVAAGIHDLATGEASNLAHLKHCEVRSLLLATNRLLAGLPLPKFGDVTVKTLTSNSETATLSYRDSKEAEPRQVEFVNVEGKWLPKTIATGWSTGIADTKGRLDGLHDWLSTTKPQVLQKLDEVGEILDRLQQAKTASEFSQAMNPLVMAMQLGTLWLEQTMQNAEPPRKGGPVHLVINRELSDDEQTKLKDAIMNSVDDSRLDYEMIPSDGKTRCRFTPIPDKDALVAFLRRHFGTTSVRINPQTKSIHVELN